MLQPGHVPHFPGHHRRGRQAHPQAHGQAIVRQKNLPREVREWRSRYSVERADKGLDDKLGCVQGVGAGDVERAVLEDLIADCPFFIWGK